MKFVEQWWNTLRSGIFLKQLMYTDNCSETQKQRKKKKTNFLKRIYQFQKSASFVHFGLRLTSSLLLFLISDANRSENNYSGFILCFTHHIHFWHVMSYWSLKSFKWMLLLFFYVDGNWVSRSFVTSPAWPSSKQYRWNICLHLLTPWFVF